jgi:hypothetical protein
MDSQPPTKGSLEELFRQHLLDSEAAAVPPRPMVWEQIDNSLLLAQNEKYRRRLLVHRWAVAASLLLAMLAGGGWWHSRQAPATDLATANPQGLPTPAMARNANGQLRGATPGTSTAYSAYSAQGTTGLAAAETATDNQLLTASNSARNPVFGSQRVSGAELGLTGRHPRTYIWSAVQADADANGYAQVDGIANAANQRVAMGSTRRLPGVDNGHMAGQLTYTTYASTSGFTSRNATQPIGTTTTFSASADGAVGFQEYTLASNSAFKAAANRAAQGEELLASRWVALPAAAPTALPTTLAPVEEPQWSVNKPKRWQFGVEYAMSAFNPNIDFSREAASYTTPSALANYSPTAASISRSAAAEYRDNLRTGLGQRLSLRANRWLGGHLSLSTGVEVAQQQATSATSSYFVGEQLADMNTVAASPRVLRTSSYRYRSAGVPIELRYSNPAKTGLSFYGRVGAVVSALLNVRSEVAGTTEASRTYTLTSANSPYRRVSGTVRGGAGVQYRPAHRHWALNVGPTAEVGTQSMNSDPAQSFWSQKRPYSIGVEAGVELGRGLRDQ